MRGLGFLLWWGRSGTCPCCLARVKLTAWSAHGADQALSGVGPHKIGRRACSGQGWPPFELSSEGTAARLLELQTVCKVQEDVLNGLEQGTVISFQLVDGGITYQRSKMDPYNWGRTLDEKIRKQKSLIEATTSEIERLESMIETWVSRPLV